MGGIDKPGLEIGGRSMLDTALAAVAGCADIVVVGPQRDNLKPTIKQVRETPAGAGPVAAIGAALDLSGSAPWVIVLGADMPFLTPSAIDALLSAATQSNTETFAIDADGRPQYLVGVWRREVLKDALSQLDSLANQPMKAIVPTNPTLVAVPDIADCDTPEQVVAARAVAARSATKFTLDEAREGLIARLTPLEPHTAPLAQAQGGALAQPITAAGALPRFDVSAMDGYAVNGDSPWQLRRDIGFAGGARPDGLRSGEAVRIATGAHVPDGTTAVVRDEFATIDGDILARTENTPIRDDIRRAGEDRNVGDLVAQAGTRVTPALRSAAASVEVTHAEVRGPLKARIVMTGDEIRADGPLQLGQTRDSIGPVLPDYLQFYGVEIVDRVHLRDTANGFDETLSNATDVDLVVVVGATGGGAADQLRAALARINATNIVERLALRPGGSTVVAETASNTTIFGLPGNPFAAIAVLAALTPSIVAARTASPPPRRIVGPLHNAAEVATNATRITAARYAPDGGFLGDPHLRTAHLAGLIDRDGLVVVRPDTPDGGTVEFLPLPR
ncbi:hypothetical protein GCM10011591_16230 [Nocardia camponoti]|uniref:Molybdopterin molybdenumtransferase n=2 Tax=Nocardia camponoti TaxID=1616106 RepID=A0A917QDG7_9NOCA|nr:hypothetical protein GCM10011591_16230 [Nocardia camponoti]